MNNFLVLWTIFLVTHLNPSLAQNAPRQLIPLSGPVTPAPLVSVAHVAPSGPVTPVVPPGPITAVPPLPAVTIMAPVTGAPPVPSSPVAPTGPVTVPPMVPAVTPAPQPQPQPGVAPTNPAPSNPGGSITSPMINTVNQLSTQTADLIQSLSHPQLISLLQIMLLQDGLHGKPGLGPILSSVGGGQGGAPGVSININIQGGSGMGTAAGATQSPLLQLTLFKSATGKSVLRVAEEIAKTELGKYITRVHAYWKHASAAVRDEHRNEILSHIDSLNVPIPIKHGIQELLPGLI